jgi:RNA polymerase sigma-B factor
MVVRHLPLARRLARRYNDGSEPLDDLVQVASLGLVKAVDRWDPGRGVPFAAFAVPTILGELRRYFRDLTWDVRPPRPTQDLWLAAAKARTQLRGSSGREPTVAELADRLGRSSVEIAAALEAGSARVLASLDAAADPEDGARATVGDLLGRLDDEYERAEGRAGFDRLTSILDESARAIVRMHYEEDLLQGEIAARLGVSPRRVSRVLRASLERLHAYCAGRRPALAYD